MAGGLHVEVFRAHLAFRNCLQSSIQCSRQTKSELFFRCCNTACFNTALATATFHLDCNCNCLRRLIFSPPKIKIAIRNSTATVSTEHVVRPIHVYEVHPRKQTCSRSVGFGITRLIMQSATRCTAADHIMPWFAFTMRLATRFETHEHAGAGYERRPAN